MSVPLLALTHPSVGSVRASNQDGKNAIVFNFDQTRLLTIRYRRTSAIYVGECQCIHLPSVERRPSRN